MYNVFQVDKSKGGVYSSSTKRFQDPKEVLPGPGHYNTDQVRLHIKLAFHFGQWTLGQPNFFWKTGTNSTVEFWPKCEWTPNFIALRQCLTTPLKLQRSPDRANSNRRRDLWSLRGVVKRCRNAIEFGVLSHFIHYPTVEFVPVFKKK